MAYDGWIEFNGVEIVNLSRTAQLAGTLGIDSVWITPGTTQWIQSALSGVDYDVVSTAPWYDADYPASAEFAGIVPLGFPGLDDSTTEASTTEYVTDGGRSGKQRNSTLTIVASVAIVASTDRGAEYGKRWLDKVLRNSGALTFCSGADLRYFRYAGAGAPVAHRRDVHLTRGSNVTRKRSVECSVTWLATFTLKCDDPFEYGEGTFVLGELGRLSPPMGDVLSSGVLDLFQESCPVYDYSPVYDPLYPALVPSPTAPDFLPAGWTITDGRAFRRHWARVSPLQPTTLRAVPDFTLIAPEEARMVRVSVWPSSSAIDDQCDPLFSAVVSYLPANTGFYIDGEQKASYTWDIPLDIIRRTDSLVYAPDAKPLQWTAFNDPTSLLVTLDAFAKDGGGFEGGPNLRVGMGLRSKSD